MHKWLVLTEPTALRCKNRPAALLTRIGLGVFPGEIRPELGNGRQSPNAVLFPKWA